MTDQCLVANQRVGARPVSRLDLSEYIAEGATAEGVRGEVIRLEIAHTRRGGHGPKHAGRP